MQSTISIFSMLMLGGLGEYPHEIDALIVSVWYGYFGDHGS